MTPGVAFVIEQLGLALAAADARITELAAENAALRELLAQHSADPATP